MSDEEEAQGRDDNSTSAVEGDGDPSPSPSFDMEYVDSLPGNRVVMPVESEGSFVWLVVRGHISPEARAQMVSDLQLIVSSGLWEQNWQPPQAD